MNKTNIASLATGAVILTASIATIAFAQRGASPSGVPLATSEAQQLANIQPGHQWLYELAWPNNQKAEFVLHADRAVKASSGTVFELRKFQMNLQGQTRESFAYMQVKDGAVFEAANATMNNTRPGFVESTQGAVIPAKLAVGTTWKWSGSDPNVVNTGPNAKSEFVGRVLRPMNIDTPLGKQLATVIEIRENVQWLQVTRRAFYVKGLGKVREEWRDGQGNVTQRLELKKFTKDAKPLLLPRGVDTYGG